VIYNDVFFSNCTVSCDSRGTLPTPSTTVASAIETRGLFHKTAGATARLFTNSTFLSCCEQKDCISSMQMSDLCSQNFRRSDYSLNVRRQRPLPYRKRGSTIRSRTAKSQSTDIKWCVTTATAMVGASLSTSRMDWPTIRDPISWSLPSKQPG
jgi:hypothetical protein